MKTAPISRSRSWKLDYLSSKLSTTPIKSVKPKLGGYHLSLVTIPTAFRPGTLTGVDLETFLTPDN